MHNNARSIMSEGRLLNYNMLLDNLKTPFDILVFSETWLTEDKIDNCNFKGFQPIHLIRPPNDDINFNDNIDFSDNIDFKLRGGGVSIFVRDNIIFKSRNDLNVMLPFMECLFIEIHFNNTKYLVGGIYRVPNTNINLFTQYLDNVIEPLSATHNLILLGDYNVDLLKTDSNTNSLEICMQSNYLIPTIHAPTRVALITNQNDEDILTETLIDNIFINYNMKHMSGVIETSITDHYSIYVIIPDIEIPNIKPAIIRYRLINERTQRTFNSYLNFFNINEVLNEYSAEPAFTKFMSIFQNSYERSFPIKIKVISHKDESHPWITESHLNAMKERDKLCKLAKKKKIDKKTYTDFRNKLNKILRVSKFEYYCQQFEFHKNNTKKTWDVINNVIKPKRGKRKIFLSDDEGTKYEEMRFLINLLIITLV